MFHLPDEDSLRLRVNYTEEFTLTLLWNVGIYGIIVTCVFLLLFLIKKYQLRLVKNQAIRESMLTQEDQSTNRMAARTSVSQDQLYEKSVKVAPKGFGFKVVNLLTSLFFYLFWIGATLIYLVFFMFGTFGRGTHIDVLSVFILTLGVVLPTLIWKQQTKTSSWQEQKGETVFTIVMLVLWLAVSVFLVVATKGACVSYYNDNYGFKVGRDIRISTEFTRIIELEQLCKEGIVCHLYPTLPEDASTSVFFNAHAGTDLGILLFKLKKNDAEVAIKNSSTPLKLDNVQSIGQRTVHSVLFTGLTADTTYDLQITDNNGVVKKTAKYKTVPGSTSPKLKMAIGGDLGMTKQGVQMTSYLQAFQPDVIVLGGDTTYDDGMRSCYSNWDELYSMFESIYEKIGRLVPLVMSVGNHDVGFDALTDNAISTADQDIPLFFYFNPQHSSSDAKTDIPQLDSRSSYHYHKIGPSLMFNLDSGYIKDFSDQTSFIRNHSTKNPQLYRFANYHNPIYPTCTNPNQGSNDRLVIDKGLASWTPLFDQFSFIASMEHHTHYRKFTYKLKNNTVSTSGTRYIGDGSWGVSQDVCPVQKYTQKPQLIEAFANQQSNHIWQITLSQTKTQPNTYQINYTAINLKGVTVIQKIEELPALQ